jgi:hypothetical protein
MIQFAFGPNSSSVEILLIALSADITGLLDWSGVRKMKPKCREFTLAYIARILHEPLYDMHSYRFEELEVKFQKTEL